MQYNGPFDQPSNPNASYVNGNPGAGVSGSIPPAASIEYDQREIVEVITDAGLTPSNADLKQLAKAIQNSGLMYGIDSSTSPGQITVNNILPVVSAYTAGMVFNVLMANTPLSTTNLSVGSGGNKPVVKTGGAGLVGTEWKSGDIVAFRYDGTHFQIALPPTLIQLSANVTYYVDGVIGSDTAFDGSQATVSGAHGPFRTLQHALNLVSQFLPGTFGATINLASQTFNLGSTATATAAWAHCPVTINGGGMSGGSATLLAGTGPQILLINGPNFYTIQNLAVINTGAVANNSCIAGNAGANVTVNSIQCNGSTVGRFLTSQNGSGTVTVKNINLNGSVGLSFFSAAASGVIDMSTAVITILQALTCTAFAEADNVGLLGAAGSGSSAAFVNPTNITGQRYNGTLNAIISTLGGGANFFPGTTAGAVTSGAQYN